MPYIKRMLTSEVPGPNSRKRRLPIPGRFSSDSVHCLFTFSVLFDLGGSDYLISISSFFTKTSYSKIMKLKSGINKTSSVIKKCVYFFDYYVLKYFYMVLEFWALGHLI